MAQLRKLAPAGIFAPSATMHRSSVAPAPTLTSSQMTLSETRAEGSTWDRRPGWSTLPSAPADGKARSQIIGRRADVPEIGFAQKGSHVPEVFSHELFVQRADAFCRLVEQAAAQTQTDAPFARRPRGTSARAIHAVRRCESVPSSRVSGRRNDRDVRLGQRRWSRAHPRLDDARQARPGRRW